MYHLVHTLRLSYFIYVSLGTYRARVCLSVLKHDSHNTKHNGTPKPRNDFLTTF